MKKFNKFAYAGALLLAGTMSFTACSSDDEVEDINPTYDGETVKAQFSINLPAEAVKGQRMTSGAAQETGNFHGMTAIKLFPMQSGAGEVSSAVRKQIDLENITTFDQGGNALGSAFHVKKYDDIQFNLGVNRAVFYAMTLTPMDGALTADYTTGTTVGENGFKLVNPYTAVAGAEDYLKGVLNAVNAKFIEKLTTAPGLQATYDSYIGKYMSGGDTKYRVLAGSSASIKALLEDMYNTISTLKPLQATPVEQNGMQEVLDAIATYFTPTGSGVPYTLKWKTDATGYNEAFADYPHTANLPDGAAAVQFDGTVFAYTEKDVFNATNFSFTSKSNYRKPAALYYFANTPVKTKDELWLKGHLSTAENWSAVQTAYTGTSVTAQTRSLILYDEVQYGVACLETSVKANADNLVDENGDAKPLGSGNFTVTGILIGGQTDADWKFQPANASPADVIYDGNFAGGSSYNLSTSAPGTNNYTLVLENTAGKEVLVALELKNNGVDFYGKDHMIIPSGTKFYLIGTLDPKDGGNSTKPGGSDLSEKIVFKQDYTTVANFKVSSLKNAYNVVPDLRAPELEFGLSVDLKWKTGLSFDVTLE